MKIVSSVSLMLALVASAPAQDGTARGTKVVKTTLSAVRKSPDAYREMWVRFPFQFASLGKVANPFFTQFEPSRYANFHGWADTQDIWVKKSYEDVFGLMFVNKRSKVAEKIYDLKVYDRIEVVGIVRNVFQSQPWIEIKEIHRMSNKVNTTTLSHMYRGETLMQKRDWKLAISELSLAPADKLPGHVLGHIHKDLAMCYLRIGEAQTARTHIDTAVSLLTGQDEAIRELAKMAQEAPEKFIDRTVANTQVQDYQRPMWEAFTNSKTDSKKTTPGLTRPTPKPVK